MSAPAGWKGRSRTVQQGVYRSTPAALLLVALLGGWQLYARSAGIAPVILPAPTDVGLALVENWALLLEASAITGATAAGGLLGGIAVGFPIAFTVSRSRSIAAFALPYVVAMRIAPLVAIAPLVFLWIGNGIGARIVLVTTMTVFPIVIASYDGLRAVPQPYLDLARSVSAPEWLTFLRIELPAAAPSVFAGVKLAAALSVVGAVVAEFVILESGLGFQVFEASTYLRTPLMFAALATLALLGVAFYGLPALVQRHSRWA